MEGYGCLLSAAAAMYQGERAVSTLAMEQSSIAKAYTMVQKLMSLVRTEVYLKWFYTGLFGLVFCKGT